MTSKFIVILIILSPLLSLAQSTQPRKYVSPEERREYCLLAGGRYVPGAAPGDDCIDPEYEAAERATREAALRSVQGSSSSTPAGAGGGYLNQVIEAVESCQAATASARSNCDFDQSESGRQVISMASQMKAQVAAGAQSSQAALCSQMGSFSQAISAAVATYSAYCSAGFANCSDACETALENAESARRMAAIGPEAASLAAIDKQISDLKGAKRECGGLSGNVNAVQQNIGSYANVEQMKAVACGKAVGGTGNCIANPNTPQCQQLARNCSNPSFAASNTVCVCMKNPNDPRCGNAGLNAGFAQKAGGASASSAAGRGGADTGKDDFGGIGNEFSGGINAVPNPNGSMDESGGSTRQGPKQMGQANLGMGDGQNKGGGAGGQAGPGGSGINTKIIGGYGVGGRGGYGGSGGGSGGYASGGGTYMGRTAASPSARPVDLRQFLPGGKMDPSRALAGISGPDGITGPNTDIWSKVRVRYFKVSPTLLP